MKLLEAQRAPPLANHFSLTCKVYLARSRLARYSDGLINVEKEIFRVALHIDLMILLKLPNKSRTSPIIAQLQN